MTAEIAPILASTAIRPVTPQHLRHLVDDERGLEKAKARAAILLRDGHAEEAGLGQRLTFAQGYCSVRSVSAACGAITSRASARARA